MSEHIRQLASCVRRALLLAGLLGTGLWRIAAKQSDLFIVELAEALDKDRGAGGEMVLVSGVLQGIWRGRVGLAGLLRRAQGASRLHWRVAARLDGVLYSWLGYR